MLLNPKFSSLIRNALALILFNKISDQVVLKNGIKFQAAHNLPLIEMIYAIHFQKLYTSNGNFKIELQNAVVDIGENIGIFSVFAGKKTKNKAHAFEPYEKNFNYLKKNVLENKLTNIIAEKFAVSNVIGLKNLFLMNNSVGSILKSKKYNGKKRNFIKVPTTTIEAIIEMNKLKKIDFLKIDCEGSEGEIVSSTSEKYLRKIEKAVLEFHDNVSSLQHDEIQKIFEKADFNTSLRWNKVSPFGFIYAYNLNA